MGYYSHIHVNGDSIVRAKKPQFTPEELADRELFEAEAKARGYLIVDTPSVDDMLTKLKNALEERRDGFGFWFYVEAGSEPDEVKLSPVGENGKAYEFEAELKEFLDFLEAEYYEWSARIVRTGEEQGDAERYVVERNKIVSVDAAELRFPDGSGIYD